MSKMNYILDESGNPIKEPNIVKWAKWFEKAERHIGNDDIGDIHISTVFLGIDHSFGLGPPLLWETMIFGGKHDQFQERYSTRAKAIAGHARAVKLVNADL